MTHQNYNNVVKILLVLLSLIVWSTETPDAVPALAVKRLHRGLEADTRRYNFVAAILLYLQKGWAFHCGASIVGPRKVVTAAHCVFDSEMVLPPPKMVAVVAGDKSWTGAGAKAVIGRVAAIYSHENYRSPHSEPDLALLILKEDLPIDNETIGIVELALDIPKDGEQCVALGWGLNEKFHISSTLMAAVFEIQPIEACILFYGVPSPNFVCGMSTGKSSVCTGDSGGPLICNNQLAGIIDSSAINCSASKPSLFTGLKDYVPWIKRERTSSANKEKYYFHQVCLCLITIMI
ncbi:unnamed protein product [Hermetia illucens]|uniref:Peptidase S1 domain-containing protein n=1 Tax=Hermetia illucens TaxID=343691 RepID=A0A7R8USN3_HERIL|nr:trypsin eta-like [Hermetia illucens]CAD7085813.1 unnamed protein product [Hermetia illucens]